VEIDRAVLTAVKVAKNAAFVVSPAKSVPSFLLSFSGWLGLPVSSGVNLR